MPDTPWLVVYALLAILMAREVMWRIKARRTAKQYAAQSLKQSRAVLKGQISEQLAPLLPDFPFHPGDVRFVGGVVDLIVFVGYQDGHVQEIVLADVKSGGARLSPMQRQVAQAVAEGRVRFETLRLPEYEKDA